MFSKKRAERNPAACKACPYAYEPAGCPFYINGAEYGLMENDLQGNTRPIQGCMTREIPKMMAHLYGMTMLNAGNIASTRDEAIILAQQNARNTQAIAEMLDRQTQYVGALLEDRAALPPAERKLLPKPE